MKNERLIAYILIAVGTVALLSRLGDADWLWMGLVAAALLAGYVTRKNYGFLVAGSIFAGLAVGEMIGTTSGTLISLGVGFFVVDRLEPRPNRWALYLAGALAGVGLFVGLGNILNSFWTALIFIAGGAYLLLRDRRSATTSKQMSTDQPAGQPTNQVSVDKPDPDATPTESTSDAQADSSVNITKDTPAQNVTNGTSSPKEAATQQTERPAEGMSPALDEPELSADERERYHLLEVWRREQARAEGRRAPYFILRNETLKQLAQKNPKTLDELDQIKGIGPVTLEKYGETILNVLRGEQPPSQPSR